MNLLEIITAACWEMGLRPPAVVVGNDDLQTQQMFYLVNRGLTELRKANDWTVLQRTFVINEASVLSTTGTVTENSASITSVADTTGIVAGTWAVSGAYINQAARVSAVSGSTVTMNMPATGSATATDLVFVQDTFALPDDLDHYLNDTWWDRTNHWQLIGPESPQVDEWHQSGIVAWGPRRTWRQVAKTPLPTGVEASNLYRLWPPLGTEESPFSIAFEYLSRLAVYSADDDIMIENFEADDDTTVLDGQALVLDLKWRFMQAKGLPQMAQYQAEYNDYLQRYAARDGAAKTLSLARGVGDRFLLTPWNVSDGNWPGNGSV